MTFRFDPNLDLTFERITDVAPEFVWAAWTEPERLMRWFTPAPWKTVACEIDLVPGGRFHTVMQSPEGQAFPNEGCYLEVVKNRRLVWTNALAPGFRPILNPPAGESDFVFTAVVSMEPHGTGTRYTATVIHGDVATREKHEAMGFEHGWGLAFDQLVALAHEA